MSGFFAAILAKFLVNILDKGLAWLTKTAALLLNISKEKTRIGKERSALNDAVLAVKKARAEGRNPSAKELKRLEDASYKLNHNFY